MKRYSGLIRHLIIIFIIALCTRTVIAQAAEKHPEAAAISAEEAHRLGERIYREGILPSGDPIEAIVKGDITIAGSMFSCQSCHFRSGLGSYEGGVLTPPTNGAKLFKPIEVYQAPKKESMPLQPTQVGEQNAKYYQTPLFRPVYTDETLAKALRDGVDSAGRKMSDIMPRYPLSDGDMKLLVAYLKSLSAEFSPGVTDKTLRFATVITDDVSPEDRQAMLVPLENFVRSMNQTNFKDPRLGYRSTGYRSRLMADVTLSNLGVAHRELLLSRWVLKGSPETWRRQLEDYYRKEPVFALLGGISNRDWQPIHKFCEENHIPDIFPITDFPVISKTDWYTLYLSKGYFREGESAAHFLNDKEELKGSSIVQIVRDTEEGRVLAKGFEETWRSFGEKAPATIALKPGKTLTEKILQEELAREKPAVVILWDGPESVKTLQLLAAQKNKPEMVIASSTFLGTSMLSLSDQVRDFTYLTYPFGISLTPEEKIAAQNQGASPMALGKSFNVEANAAPRIRITQQSYIMTTIMNMAMLDMKGNYYRDNLLDVISMNEDQDVPLYERLSFGPGQRFASKGCYIVQLSKGEKPVLVKKSNWEIH